MNSSGGVHGATGDIFLANIFYERNDVDNLQGILFFTLIPSVKDLIKSKIL